MCTQSFQIFYKTMVLFLMADWYYNLIFKLMIIRFMELEKFANLVKDIKILYYDKNSITNKN